MMKFYPFSASLFVPLAIMNVFDLVIIIGNLLGTSFHLFNLIFFNNQVSFKAMLSG